MWPTMATPCSSRSKARPRRRRRRPRRASPAPRQRAPEPEHEASDSQPDDAASATGCRRACVTRSQSFSKKSPLPFSTPNSLGSWPDDDGQRQTDDEALEHRLGDEVGHEPSRSSPAITPTIPWRSPAPRSGRRTGAPGRGELADDRRRQRRRRRHRPDDQVPGAAEGRVQQQRAGRRVQPDDRRGRRRSSRRPAPRGPAPPTPSARRDVAAQPLRGSRAATERPERHRGHGAGYPPRVLARRV